MTRNFLQFIGLLYVVAHLFIYRTFHLTPSADQIKHAQAEQLCVI